MSHDALLNAEIRRTARSLSASDEAADRNFALAQLYDLTAERLLRLAVSILRRQHDAEDAVSAVMVKIAERPRVLVEAERPWHYLLRMVRNESLVLVRGRSRWSSIGEFAHRLIGRSVDVVEQRDENRQIWEALASLPTPQSEVVVLKTWEQLTFAEVAEVLQLTPSTAASRYRYGLEKLSQKLSTPADQVADEAMSPARRPVSLSGEGQR
jgi:RNA polymerase sigma-70 factor (ECF subfamily)